MNDPEPNHTHLRRRPRLLLSLVIVAVVIVLSFPVTFRLPVEGVIEPARLQRVFAPVGGNIASVDVRTDETIETGTPILVLENPSIQLRFETLTGELVTARTELASLRVDPSNLSPDSDPQGFGSSTRRRILQERVESLCRQVELAEQLVQSMIVKAPIDGVLSAETPVQGLVGRDVYQGQWLVDVVDATAGYIAELSLDDQEFGYLASHGPEQSMTCRLRLRSDPSVRHDGVITRVSETVQVNAQGAAVIRLTSDFDTDADVRRGSTVVGSIDVGKRSLLFVLFRPAVEFLRSYGW